MKVLATERLILRKLSIEDAGFILGLLNQPSFLRFIGDKGVRTLEDAREYLLQGPVDSYRQHGFGLYRVELKGRGIPIGICGLVKREALADVDVGFAFLPQFWRRGYAFEAASAVLAFGSSSFGLSRIVAVTQPDNRGSIRTLEKLGLRFERRIRLAEDEPELQLFAVTITAAASTTRTPGCAPRGDPGGGSPC